MNPKTNKLLLFALHTLLFYSCKGQSTTPKEIYNPDFKWTITIPQNFDQVSKEDWAKIQNKGEEAIEKTYDAEVNNQTEIIFVFKSDGQNYFESNSQPFDTATDGNYIESVKNVGGVLYKTFKAQFPDAKLDTAYVVEKIDGFNFQVFKIKIHFANNVIFNAWMFSRVFGKREFSANIMYVDEAKGEVMLDAWRKSKFSK